jgi:hypothetical protein
MTFPVSRVDRHEPFNLLIVLVALLLLGAAIRRGASRQRGRGAHALSERLVGGVAG